MAVAVSEESVVSSTRSGPSVPEISATPALTVAENVPVMPVMEKREENVVIVPPAVATETILRKLESVKY